MIKAEYLSSKSRCKTLDHRFYGIDSAYWDGYSAGLDRHYLRDFIVSDEEHTDLLKIDTHLEEMPRICEKVYLNPGANTRLRTRGYDLINAEVLKRIGYRVGCAGISSKQSAELCSQACKVIVAGAWDSGEHKKTSKAKVAMTIESLKEIVNLIPHISIEGPQICQITNTLK